ncbi:hypothetical protein E4U53_005692 [Claviceps sorghi]|nr:hypothetical protein E4U53_005692 [Claviceps sorghi]
MAKRQRTTDPDPERTFFASQREALLSDIALMGNDFSSVEALWSQFETVMAKDDGQKPPEQEEPTQTKRDAS